MKQSLLYSLIAIFLFFLGMILIFQVSLKIALGVFLILWARTLAQRARGQNNLEKILKK